MENPRCGQVGKWVTSPSSAPEANGRSRLRDFVALIGLASLEEDQALLFVSNVPFDQLARQTRGVGAQGAAGDGRVESHGGEPGAVETLHTVDLPLANHFSGKVRESWSLPTGERLLVTTDRLSALDRIIGLVPHKGQVLNQLAAWWFDRTSDIVANHVVSVPDPNALIAREAETLPIEVVVRARLTGSTSTSILPRYEAGERELYGHHLPDGLTPHGPLPGPMITPTTKAEAGEHDVPITVDAVVEQGFLEPGLWAEVQKVALELFDRGSRLAEEAGFVLADTKYEFGLDAAGQLMLIDEMHTPDSSRYWNAEGLQDRLDAGLAPEGFDKEPVRLALRDVGYRGDGPPPELDPAIWIQTSDRYVELYERLTGKTFEPGDRPIQDRLHRNLQEHLS